MASKRDLAARFYDKVGPPDANGCRRWEGAYSIKSRNRPARPVFWVARLYIPGQESYKGASQLLVPAARMALHLKDGVPLDERVGLEACHKPCCANPWCVADDHLYWGTPDENRADRYAPGQAGAPVVRDFGNLLGEQGRR